MRPLILAEARQQRAGLTTSLAFILTWLAFRQSVTMDLPLWVDWTRGTLFALVQLLGLTMVLTAWIGGRDRAMGLDEFRGRAVLTGRASHLLPLGVALGAIISGWLLAALGRLILVVADGAVGTEGLHAAAPFTAVAWLVGTGSAGFAIGRLLRPRWIVAPAAGFLTYVLPLGITFARPDFETATPIPWDLWQAHGAWDLRLMILSVTTALAVCGAGVALYHLSHRPNITSSVAVAGLLAIAGGTTAGSVEATSWRPLPADADLRPLSALTCHERNSLRLCTHPAHGSLLETVNEDALPTSATAITIRMDIGLGQAPRLLAPEVYGAGLDVVNGQAGLPMCAIRAVLTGRTQPVAPTQC